MWHSFQIFKRKKKKKKKIGAKILTDSVSKEI